MALASIPTYAYNRKQRRLFEKKGIPHVYIPGETINLGIKKFKREYPGTSAEAIAHYKKTAWEEYRKSKEVK